MDRRRYGYDDNHDDFEEDEIILRQSIVINVNFTDIAIIRCGKVGVDRSPLNGSKKSLHPQSAH